ncbi:MAG: sulfur oxidation c-type cytochrome SoxA, partial [Burkholderiales bacterium]
MKHWCGVAAVAIVCAVSSYPVAAQHKPGNGLAVGRQMLAEDNPGDLWAERGKRLFNEKRGPKNASLEQCDLGIGPGVVKGAFAQLPRYFADTDKVQDLESRLLTCMVNLQGFKREDIVRTRFGNLDRDSDMEAL